MVAMISSRHSTSPIILIRSSFLFFIGVFPFSARWLNKVAIGWDGTGLYMWLRFLFEVGQIIRIILLVFQTAIVYSQDFDRRRSFVAPISVISHLVGLMSIIPCNITMFDKDFSYEPSMSDSLALHPLMRVEIQPANLFAHIDRQPLTRYSMSCHPLHTVLQEQLHL